ncbi:unnamed protein product, partial [Caretta caretta]
MQTSNRKGLQTWKDLIPRAARKCRFILHIPSEERDNAIRVCFQIELAHWFYLDFYMQNTPGLPQCGIRDFAKADILFI